MEAAALVSVDVCREGNFTVQNQNEVFALVEDAVLTNSHRALTFEVTTTRRNGETIRLRFRTDSGAIADLAAPRMGEWELVKAMARGDLSAEEYHQRLGELAMARGKKLSKEAVLDAIGFFADAKIAEERID